MLNGFKYKENVLGKDVAVKFRVARSATAAKNYLGTIRRMQVHLDDDGEIEILHQVIYQDGDEEWYDLEELEESGRLAWLNFGENGEQVAMPAKKSSTTTKKKKIKREAPSEDEVDGDDENAKKRSTKKRAKTLVSTSSTTTTTTTTTTPPPPSTPVAGSETTPVKKEEGETEKKEKEESGEDDAEATDEANVVSPEKPSEPRPPREPAEDEKDLPKWVIEMHDWMLHVPHGSKNSCVSETNARSVMRQVKKLVRGEGISYKNWDEGITFYESEKVDLHFDFEEMLTQAKRFEGLHGKDKGNGWLMQHPITKLDLYKQYRVENNMPLD